MSMTTEAFERIRDAIVTGGLDFGEPLSETQIAKALGMSKAPVRAAFIELRDKGLVSVVPQSGTYVFSPTAEDVHTMSHFRALLEDEALRESFRRQPERVERRLRDAIESMRKAVNSENWDAYRRFDSAFHFAFLEESGNRYVEKAYLLTSTALEALRVRLQGGEGGFRIRSFNEHIAITDFLKANELGKAAKLLRQHILIINEWVDTLPLGGDRISRKDKPEDRDYAAVFSAPRL
ncbi:MAG TPA: GntR family transcriptional regulator [Devosia sp.]|nr:GntR family transcriptional regulator [Devosia sp.]